MTMPVFPGGVAWQALIFKNFTITLQPQLNFSTGARPVAFDIVIPTPQVSVTPPQTFTIQINPRLKVATPPTTVFPFTFPAQFGADPNSIFTFTFPMEFL